MKKVLIISYYWPPSGGAGVQRWLKLSYYLQSLGVQVFVICPKSEEASYFAYDQSLVHEIHPDIKVVPTSSFEPVNYYKRLVGKKNVPTAGFSNVDPKNKFQKISLFLRSNIFIPDPRKFWGNPAFKAASKLIKEEGINHVITTSPPHSAQLIGLRLKNKFGIKWIADLRDLWTDVYYYGLLQHSKWSKKRDAALERKVLESADHITTVSPGFIRTFLTKSSRLHDDKFSFIPNGFDPKDFSTFDYSFEPDFVLTYTGTINMQYNFAPFLHALEQFVSKYPDSTMKIRFVGFVDELLKESIKEVGLLKWFDFVGYVSHSSAIHYLQESYALLLFGPLNKNNEEGGIPAKVFEYLNAGRKVIYVGKKDGFVAKILSDCKGGRSFEHNTDGLFDYLEGVYMDFKERKFDFKASAYVSKYSRSEQAAKFHRLLNSI